jgi:hypothetical protein
MPVDADHEKESRPESKTVTEPVKPARSAESPRGPDATPTAQRREPSHVPTPPERVRSVPVTPEKPSRSLNMFFVYLVMLVIVGLVGYGVFVYIGPGTQKSDELLKQLSSTEGLRIITATGSVDGNGDLLIKCVIENSLNKERPVWYVVVEIYNDQGVKLSRIRSINGKQLYTQRDYDIFSKRGVNVQDLKARGLQDQGVAVPSMGSVTFELRYLQPPGGVTSFNAFVEPFDPVRLFKELSEEIQQ